ncbi:hypothetical protein WICMUC_003844, partial [Wickerhamomyces mucosus]
NSSIFSSRALSLSSFSKFAASNLDTNASKLRTAEVNFSMFSFKVSGLLKFKAVERDVEGEDEFGIFSGTSVDCFCLIFKSSLSCSEFPDLIFSD